jgi:hypothetical protein
MLVRVGWGERTLIVETRDTVCGYEEEVSVPPCRQKGRAREKNKPVSRASIVVVVARRKMKVGRKKEGAGKREGRRE